MSIYSMDLRKRVMDALDSGMKKSVICKIFNICYQTIYNWIKRKEKTGDVQPITNFQNGHSHAIKDLEEFKRFISTHADLTQEEMARKLNVSPATIGRYLNKIRVTRKKNLQRIRKGMKIKERSI